jgi:adenylosuccinate synthase
VCARDRRRHTSVPGCNQMKTVAVVGTQWGDEGKGKIVDLLSANADVVVRFQGGNNAAHTVVANGRKYILRQVPAGALHEGKVCVIGNGAVIDPIALLEELDRLQKENFLTRDGCFRLSYDAHLVMPYHRAIDRGREARLGKAAIGTTGNGIGPAYEDKVARLGLRVGDLVDFKSFSERLKRTLTEKNLYLKAVLKTKPIPLAELLASMKTVRRRLMPYLCDTGAYLDEAIVSGRRIMFEGAHGTMLDIDHGTYPFVTSSNCVASAAFAGSGVGPGKLDAVLGISKAYTTRVGAGPFPSEISGALGDSIREEGAEFGSGSGRPRRIGWFDAVVARYAARVNGLWKMALTKFDVLTGVDPLMICVAYEIRGKRYDEMPPGRAMLDKVTPVYEDMPGWSEDLGSARSLAEMPPNARRYVERLSEVSGVPLAMIGLGAAREAAIVIDNPFAG